MAIAPIVIQLLAQGMPQVSQSFKNVADTATKAERQIQREAERASKARERIADNEAKAKVRAWQKADAEVRRAQNAGAREAERISRNATRMAEREARDKVRTMAKADAEIQRIRERSAAQAARLMAREESERNRAAMAWVKQREKEAASERSARAKVAQSMIGSGAQGVANGVKRVAGVAAGLAGTAAQLGGGFSLADSLQGEKALRHKAAQLSASTILSRAGQPGEEGVGRSFGTDELVSKAKAIGIEQNLDPSKILDAVDTIKGLTGNVEKAVEVVPYVAKLATATGGDVSEMSGLAANILASNSKISQQELEEQLRVFTRQGVVGGVEVADFAKYGSRLTAGASLFGGREGETASQSSSRNQATMGAFAQIARQYGGASSASEAALAAQRFATDVASHADSLKKQGINVTDGKGNLRDAQSIIMDMVAKTGGDVTKMKDMGLGERGVKALTGVSAIYKNAGGGKAGMDEIEKEFAKYTKGVSADEVDLANKRVLGEGGASLDQAMMRLRNTVGEQLLPEFIKLVPVIQEAAPVFAGLLRDAVPPLIDVIKQLAAFAQAHKDTIATLAKNPVGTLIAFEVSKSFASAGLPELLRSLMTNAFSPAAGGAGANGAAGAAGGVGGFLAAGVAAEGMAAWNLYSGTKGALASGRAGGAAAGRALGSADPAERAAAEAAIASARGKSGALDQSTAWTDRIIRGMSIMSGPGALLGQGVEAGLGALGVSTGGKHAEETIKASAFVSEADKMAQSSREAADALSALAGAARGAGAGNSGPNGAGRKDSLLDR